MQILKQAEQWPFRCADSRRTAMPAPLPTGITFHYLSPEDGGFCSSCKDIDNCTAVYSPGTTTPPAVQAVDADGKYVGHLNIGQENGHDAVDEIRVRRDARRHGIATAMLDFARQFHPHLQHSGTRSDLGEKWVNYEQKRHTPSGQYRDLRQKVKIKRSRIAMPAPTPKLDITHKEYSDGGGMVEARHPGAQHNWKGGKSLVGYLQYNPDGEIAYIETHPDYRRHGIADAMYDYADQFVQNLHHSRERSGLGDLWVEHERTR